MKNVSTALGIFVSHFILLFTLQPATQALSAHPHLLIVRKAHPKTLTVSQVARLTMPSIVRLTVLDAQGKPVVQGSGVVVGHNLIATNGHVILGAHAVTANFQNGRSVSVYGVASVMKDVDLALLYADTSGARPLPLALGEDDQVGDAVVAIGSPEGLGGSISTGVISGIRKIGSTRVFQTTAPISHGSSGGALLDMCGRVVGITSFYMNDGQNLNFAFAASYVHYLLLHKLATYNSWHELEPYWPKPAGNSSVSNSQLSDAPAPPAPAPVVATAPSVNNPPIAPTISPAENVLTGLSGVAVQVFLDDGAKANGINPVLIKAEVETRLRRVGVTVYDRVFDARNLSLATLEINITTLGLKDSLSGIYSYSVVANLYESGTVQRQQPTINYVSTWNDGSMGVVGSAGLADGVTQLTDASVDKFATDYITQNTKSP